MIPSSLRRFSSSARQLLPPHSARVSSSSVVSSQVVKAPRRAARAPFSSHSTESKNAPTTQSAPKYTPEMVYVKEAGASDLFRGVQFPVSSTEQSNKALRELVNDLFQKHKPSAHSFFRTLKNADKAIVTNKGFLSEFYFRYQAAMHATRVAVYFSPHLNTPALRQRKISIIVDDDSHTKLSHHKQLEAMFQRFGASTVHEDTFGDLDELAAMCDPRTKAFIHSVMELYPRTTGAWCIAEVLSDDWLSALADSFSPFFPFVLKEQYFDEVFSGHVEIEHMIGTVQLTESILQRRPQLLEQTLSDARKMAANLDGLWDNLELLVLNPTQYLK